MTEPGTVMLCEIRPPSFQPLQTYRTPAPPGCGELVAMVCVDPGIQLSISGAATGVPPSAETKRLAGLVVIVIDTAVDAKFPVTVAGALGMVKLVLAEVVEPNDPPVEVQLVKWKPLLAVAVTGTLAPPAKYCPEVGVTEPSADGEACVVSWYCVLKAAV